MSGKRPTRSSFVSCFLLIDEVIAVRNAVDQPGTPTFALRYAGSRKGSFDRILEGCRVR